MNVAVDIQYIRHAQIDKAKWDKCISNAGNGCIYGFSFYLDTMATHWDALVLNEYEAVMPLTWNRKYGIHYLFQPFLAAQLGVFGRSVSNELLSAFLKAIPSKFNYWDIYLNRGNVFSLNDFTLYLRSNFVLDLERPYEELYSKFSSNIQRNIKKAAQAGCTIQKDFDEEKVIRLAVEQMRSHSNESKENINRFRKLYQYLHSRQMATTYGIFSAANELLASCIFFFSHSRAYYILVGNDPKGKATGASHALIDGFIKDHAGRRLLLDFEGSDIPNLALFYSSFGAIEEKFSGIKLNRLPFYLRWIKK